MQHMMSVVTEDAGTKDVCYVDSGASNNMTYHQNWFIAMKEPNKPGYVEIGDDTMHPIEHVGNVPLSMHDGKEKYMADVLHVQTITKRTWFQLAKWLSRDYKYDSTNMAVLLKTLKISANWLLRAVEWEECLSSIGQRMYMQQFIL